MAYVFFPPYPFFTTFRIRLCSSCGVAEPQFTAGTLRILFNLCVFMMNLTALLNSQHEKSGEQLNDLNRHVANALIYVLENFLLQLAPSFVLTVSCRRSHTCNFYNDLLEKLFQMWAAPPMQIVHMPPSGSLHVPGRRYFNLILVDSYESFSAIDAINYTSKYNNNEYYYIFLQTKDEFLPREMSSIFDYCWRNYIINCNVQVQTARGEILIFTYFPYTPHKCAQPITKLINSFNGTTLINQVLFPKKLMNFYGCKLRAAIWDVPPFIYLKTAKNGSLEMQHGIEARVIQELARKLNFVIEVLVPPNDEQRGVVKGENLTGALLMLDKRIADFSLGCFRLSFDRAIATTATFSYYQSSQIVCAPLAAYTFSSIEILLFPFAASMWLLLLTIWAISFAIISTINKYYHLYPALFAGHSTTHSQLNVLLMAIGMPATRMPMRFFSRLISTDWMFFTLIIRTAYQALLFHLIRTQPINHLPRSFDELVEYNYTVVVNRGTYLALNDVQFLSELHLQVINKIEETVAFEFIEKYPRKRLVAGGPLDFLAYYGIEFKKAGVFRQIPQHILSLPLTMYLTKHSYLIDQFDEELMGMRSMGFLEIWSRWELDYNYLRSSQVAQSKVFGLDELYMMFVIGFAGLIFATLTFLLEMLSLRVALLRCFLAKI